MLQIVQHGRVLQLTLDRPEKRNALNGELCLELVDAMESAGRNAGVGAILLAGKGKSFCAGMDLDEAALGVTETTNAAHERLFTVGARLTKPLIAAVQGGAIGGGTGLVANCHIVIAGADATFGLTEIRLGLWPFLVYRAAAAALGERRTLELALTGRIFGADEAREIGLVHETTADLEKRALEVAQTVAGYSPTAIQCGLGFVQQVRGENWDVAGQTARRLREQIFASADFQEGLSAFQDKRSPRWPSLGS